LNADHSTISGGRLNAGSAIYSAIAGGFTNAVSAAATYGFIGGGSNNTASGGTYNTIVGGYNNSCADAYGCIIGGFTNIIPAGCTYSSILGGANITAAQSSTAYTPRLTTTGGRQKKNTRVTNTSVQLGLDDHFVTIYNTSGNITVTLPASPVDGQEYNIKCMLATGTVRIVGLTGGVGKNIQSTANIAPYADFIMAARGQAAHMIYSTPDGNWCMMT
jgi:hypothetical protein